MKLCLKLGGACPQYIYRSNSPISIAFGAVQAFLIIFLSVLTRHVNLSLARSRVLLDLTSEKVVELRSSCVFLAYASSMRENPSKRENNCELTGPKPNRSTTNMNACSESAVLTNSDKGGRYYKGPLRPSGAHMVTQHVDRRWIIYECGVS